MRDLADFLVQLGLLVGLALVVTLVFDLGTGGLLAGCGARLGRRRLVREDPEG
ncbi:hypothetical protein [Arthrobacter cheniae]|uniref:hypothetical protein n=1 Tax=Arthrobacter cheniae TaxID=1258888 RepID=UPI0016027C75|nr:hypothetical protein [Arthrobacter cheniae]